MTVMKGGTMTMTDAVAVLERTPESLTALLDGLQAVLRELA